VLNKYEQEEVIVKIKPDQTVWATDELESNTRDQFIAHNEV
jgi:hypothetical protein